MINCVNGWSTNNTTPLMTFFENSYHDLENFDNKGPATEYKWKGKTHHLSPIVAQKLKCFIKWMTHEERPYELHDDFLATLTRDNYLKFRHLDTQSFSSSPSSYHEPSKLKTNRNMSKSKGWTLQSSLLMLWMEKTRVNNQTKIDDDVNLLKIL